MKKIIKFIKVVVTGILILLLSILIYTFYSTYKVSGTYVKTSRDWFESSSIVHFNLFSKSQYFSIDSREDIKDNFYFAFENFIFNDDYLRSGTIHSNTDSIILQDNYTHADTFKKIPDSLKNKEEFNIKNKLIEHTFKTHDTIIVDTTYYSEKYYCFKSQYYNKGVFGYQKWNTGSYKILDIDNYKIMMLDLPTHFIIKNYGNKLIFHQVTKDSIVNISARILKTSENMKKEIDLEIQKRRKIDSLLSE